MRICNPGTDWVPAAYLKILPPAFDSQAETGGGLAERSGHTLREADGTLGSVLRQPAPYCLRLNKKDTTVKDRALYFQYIRYMYLANYGASEAVNLCSRYVDKSTKCSELKCANSFRE
jgi:hypothetical protein